MSSSPVEGGNAHDQDEGRWDGYGTAPAAGHEDADPRTEHAPVQGVPAENVPELARAQLEAERAGDHMNWAVEQARDVDFQPGSLQMAEVAAADLLYRKTRRHLSHFYSQEDEGQ